MSRFNKYFGFAIGGGNVISSRLDGGKNQLSEGIEVKQEVGCGRKRWEHGIFGYWDCDRNDNVGASWPSLLYGRGESQMRKDSKKSPNPEGFVTEHEEVNGWIRVGQTSERAGL